MKFEKFLPTNILRPYVKYLVISEALEEQTYKIFPSAGLVVGFQYKGKLAYIENESENPLAVSGITGLQDSFRVFKSAKNIGSVLVFFNEIGASYFFHNPINELFNESLSLDNLVNKSEISRIEDLLSETRTDQERINIVEQFLLLQLTEKQEDKMVTEAVRQIYEAKGKLKMKQLADFLYISQSPFEKRFRKIVGTSPKKFASIIRFNHILTHLQKGNSLDQSYENDYFDQAHFIKDFKHFTGETPEQFLKTRL
jgi:AraC-like DNA-binding protein